MGVTRWRGFAGIRGYIGGMGSGKTYLMTAEAIKALRQGREVWANAGYHVRDRKSGRETHTYVSLQEMLLAPQGTLLLLDEVGTFMNARKWTELPRGLMYRLTQSRKDSLGLIYTAQHEMQVDVALRRLTAEVTYIRRFGPLGIATRHRPIDLRAADDKPLGRSFFMLRKEVLDAYDTLARVWVPPEVLEELEAELPAWVPLDDEMMLRLRDMASRRTAIGEAVATQGLPEGRTERAGRRSRARNKRKPESPAGVPGSSGGRSDALGGAPALVAGEGPGGAGCAPVVDQGPAGSGNAVRPVGGNPGYES